MIQSLSGSIIQFKKARPLGRAFVAQRQTAQCVPDGAIAGADEASFRIATFGIEKASATPGSFR